MSVRVQGLTRRFHQGGFPAVSDASFAAPDGAITALLGPSGSGKTTLLRIIAGLEEPDAGAVYFDDEETTRRPVRERGVGLVFQGYALFGAMTVRENVAFGLDVRKTPRRDVAARVDELLSLVQLEGLADRYPRELSGGQQQRVAFARALAPRPRVLLLDEPFGALDTRVRMELREWLRELHARTHVTTILVTHDQAEALELSEHVVLMREGRVEQAGAPHELYDRPATPFVAAFLGGGSVLRGRVQSGRTALGSMSVAAPMGAAEGAAVDVYVRPHDVKLALPVKPVAALARILRLARVGAESKVELEMPTGEPMLARISNAELDALGVVAGDGVVVDFASAQVFVADRAG